MIELQEIPVILTTRERLADVDAVSARPESRGAVLSHLEQRAGRVVVVAVGLRLFALWAEQRPFELFHWQEMVFGNQDAISCGTCLTADEALNTVLEQIFRDPL